jgi:uncharacterized membrane protein YbhN (UPF0104 family)
MTTRRLAFVLRCIFSAALIALVLRKVSWGELSEILKHTDTGWALVASPLTAFLVIGLAVRWRIFLRGKGIDIPFRIILALSWSGQFFNAVLPGSTGGDIIKIYQACRLHPGGKAAAAATVLADRLTGVLALLFLAGIGLAINPLPLRILAHQTPIGPTAIYLLSMIFILISVAGWFVSRSAHGRVWGGRALRTLGAVKDSFTFDRRWVTAFFLSVAMHLMTTLIAHLFAKALGLSLTYLQALLIIPVIALFVMLPVTINGHGLRELLLIAYFSEMGLTIAGTTAAVREIAVALSFLMVTSDLLWALPGGILYFLRFKSVDRPILNPL